MQLFVGTIHELSLHLLQYFIVGAIAKSQLLRSPPHPPELITQKIKAMT
ncbi:hypothetical protein [Cylindrospermum sp. FACHB-282]|nr:hypothetical protein [Cylindrospermum sp. FACHB-282]MBD2386642.1 hypothetical protein [Cylindrospermum sp. FACHB-282]